MYSDDMLVYRTKEEFTPMGFAFFCEQGQSSGIVTHIF